MKRLRFSLLPITCALCVLCAAMLLGGCTNISDRTITVTHSTEKEENDDYIPGVGGDLLIIDTDTGEEDGSGDNSEDGQPTDLDNPYYSFSPEQEAFIASCLFMGDSICSGIGSYGFSPNCFAKAGVAARNILEFTFDYNGYQVGPLTALVNSGSKDLVFLMGTNDVNMVSPQEYAEFYDNFLSKVESSCPGVVIFVVSVPPVTADSDFCYNSQLDDLNRELKAMIESGSPSRHYIDAAALLKDERGALRETYSAGDGIHLSRSAYYALLHALCVSAGVR